MTDKQVVFGMDDLETIRRWLDNKLRVDMTINYRHDIVTTMVVDEEGYPDIQFEAITTDIQVV